MSTDSSAELTRLLNRADSLDEDARARLLSLVYEQLRAIANQRMASERQDHTLQATALVHEAYLRLFSSDSAEWRSRAHFFHAAAEAMHRILIDAARRRNRIKRGGGRLRVQLDGVDLARVIDDENHAVEFVALDDALQRLKVQDERAHEVVMLRFFAGLDIEQTASALGVSVRTVKRDWTFARAWLFASLEESQRDAAGEGGVEARDHD